VPTTNRREEIIRSAPKENINYSLLNGRNFSPQKRKTHFLTVVSRLPGFQRPKNNC